MYLYICVQFLLCECMHVACAFCLLSMSLFVFQISSHLAPKQSLILSSNFGDIFRAAASNYLRKAGEAHSTVEILISVGKLLKYA